MVLQRTTSSVQFLNTSNTDKESIHQHLLSSSHTHRLHQRWLRLRPTSTPSNKHPIQQAPHSCSLSPTYGGRGGRLVKLTAPDLNKIKFVLNLDLVALCLAVTSPAEEKSNSIGKEERLARCARTEKIEEEYLKLEQRIDEVPSTWEDDSSEGSSNKNTSEVPSVSFRNNNNDNNDSADNVPVTSTTRRGQTHLQD
uniref:Uncharacterized protein n=1 Tax=Timema bartmani TaxID=61472 RepID=A0A7R9I564_9NEOP|nr:unnamed protein product [Timema bartmani]